MEHPDDRPATRSPSTGLRRAQVAGVVTTVVVGAACAVVIGLRAANHDAEPEGQNWWLVAWFVTGLAYSLAGVLLVGTTCPTSSPSSTSPTARTPSCSAASGGSGRQPTDGRYRSSPRTNGSTTRSSGRTPRRRTISAVSSCSSSAGSSIPSSDSTSSAAHLAVA